MILSQEAKEGTSSTSSSDDATGYTTGNGPEQAAMADKRAIKKVSRSPNKTHPAKVKNPRMCNKGVY
jgi:hypothetical protein